MRVLLTGATGQVGSELHALLGGRASVVAPGREELDLSRPEEIAGLIRELRPDLVLNAAAYTAVDRAEREPEIALALNAHAPGVIGEEARRLGCAVVHYSTDYVFDGKKDLPYVEDDPTAPLSVYGQTKELGDRALADSGAFHLTFRVSWVYSSRPGNFLTKMLALMGERDTLRVVADEVGAPTRAREIAEATVAALEAIAGPVEIWTRPSLAAGARARGGLFHLAPAGQTSWLGFAEEIRLQARRAGLGLAVRELLPIAGSDWPSPVTRPRSSRLSRAKLAAELGVRLGDWREGVAACVRELASRPAARLAAEVESRAVSG